MRVSSVWFFAIAMCVLAVTPLSAQKGTVVRRTIHFKKGTSTAHVEGVAAWGTSYKYLFSARAGQRVVIAIKGRPTFSFHLIVPPEADGEQPEGVLDDVGKWSGVLNDSGRYEIVVSHTINGVATTPYELSLEIH